MGKNNAGTRTNYYKLITNRLRLGIRERLLTTQTAKRLLTGVMGVLKNLINSKMELEQFRKGMIGHGFLREQGTGLSTGGPLLSEVLKEGSSHMTFMMRWWVHAYFAQRCTRGQGARQWKIRPTVTMPY